MNDQDLFPNVCVVLIADIIGDEEGEYYLVWVSSGGGCFYFFAGATSLAGCTAAWVVYLLTLNINNYLEEAG